MKEKIELFLSEKYKGLEIIYDINFSPLLLNGVENIQIEGLTIVVFNDEEKQKIFWNEKNQSNVVYYEKQIMLFQNKLKEIENKAVTF